MKSKPTAKSPKHSASRRTKPASAPVKLAGSSAKLPARKKTPAPKTVRPKSPKAASAKASSLSKKAGVFVEAVKDGLHAGLDSVVSIIEKVTPDALLPASMKSKRKSSKR